MFDKEYETPKRPKLPTLLQYCKTCGKGVQGKTRFNLDVIWLPGKFGGYTLQTHAFRVSIPENHGLYTAIGDYVSAINELESYSQPGIIITSIDDGMFKLVANTKIKGGWEKIGSNGYRFVGPT